MAFKHHCAVLLVDIFLTSSRGFKAFEPVTDTGVNCALVPIVSFSWYIFLVAGSYPKAPCSPEKKPLGIFAKLLTPCIILSRQRLSPVRSHSVIQLPMRANQSGPTRA